MCLAVFKVEERTMEKKTNEELKREVTRELSWDTRTWNQKIDVDVDEGVVTLSGTASSYGERKAAEAAAHRVFGVTDVANEILIKIERPHSDAEIAHAVRQALEWDALVPSTQITSTVSGGWVKLEGKVNSLTERADARRAVENLIGVAGVINELEVQVPKTDVNTLRESIETALERRADREAERFRIELVGSEVNLFGRVHSWPEKKAVLGSISHARGVTKINDHLRIDPYF
jgi:osmotically-inducible protein OsmY